MSKFCPNKNTADFKSMSAALGDSIATSVWYENSGEPIWNNPDGSPSTLWSELTSHPGVKDMEHATQIKSNMYTKSFKNAFPNRTSEPTMAELMNFINNKNEVAARFALYQELKLTDKNDPTKPIKWSDTTANYKKVLKLVQKINSGERANAKIVKVASGNKSFITIQLTPKTAFTTAEGDVTASFDAKTGTITFGEKGLTAETVIHEFAHPFVDALATNNPKLYKNLLASIKKDSNVPEIAKILDHVATNYKGNKTIADKELLAYTISEYGKGNIDVSTGTNTKTAIKRFYDWLNSLAADVIKAIKKDGTIYVDRINPKTPYNTVADIFTVYSELGTIDLSASPVVAELTSKAKTDPKTIAQAKPVMSALQKKMAERKAKSTKEVPPAYKMVETKDAEFVDIVDEANHMSSLLPKEIATELTDGYVKVLSGGQAVVGMFEDAMISLSKQGPKGTAYHEGFHAVFRTLLDADAQAALYTEAKAEYVDPTAKDIFDLQLQHNISAAEAQKLYYEELMADDFALFMSNPAEEFSPGIRGFFEKIANWISEVFNKPTKKDKLFKNISLGKYTKQTPNITRGIAYKVHPLFSIQDVNTITRELASVAFQNINTIDDLRASSVTLSTIADSITDSAIAAEETGNTELIERLELLFDQETGEIDMFWLKEVDAYLRNSLGLVTKRAKKEQKITEDSQEELSDEDLDKGNFLKSSYEISGKTNATAAVKFLVAMTPKMELINKAKPATIENMTQTLSPLTGLPVLVDFGMFYNDVENSLSNIVSTKVKGVPTDPLATMLLELKKQSKYKPEMLTLAAKIENASEEVRTQFFKAFSKNKGSFVHHQISSNTSAQEVDKKIYSSKLTTSNFSTKSTIITQNWIQGFAKAFSTRENNQDIYDVAKQEVFALESQLLRNDIVQFVKETTAGVKPTVKPLATFTKVLNSLGVTLNPNTLNYIIEERLQTEEGVSYEESYSEALEDLYYDFTQATRTLKDKSGDIFNNNHIADEGSFFTGVLAEAEAYFKQLPGENAFVGPDGNTIYSYQNNDSVSKTLGAIKQGDLTHLENVAKSAYGKHSIWTKSMLDSVNGSINIEEFGVHMYGNLKSEATAGDKGAKASELKPIDAYMDQVNKQLSGYYIGLAEADKSRQSYFKGPELLNSAFTVNNDNKFVMSVKGQGMKAIQGYLADELSRMSIAHDVVYGTATAESLPEEQWILNYHYYNAPKDYTGVRIGKDGDKIPGNAFHSFLFPDINLESLGLKNANGTMNALSDQNFWSSKPIQEMIKTKFGALVQDEMEHAAKIGLLTKKEDGTFENNLISASIITNPSKKYTQGGAVDITRVMADYVLNSIVGNIEQTKLFNMDPAGYKVKGVGTKKWSEVDHFGDFMKRIPAAFASGLDYRIFNTKDGIPVVRPTYTSATIANITVPSAFFGTTNENGDVSFNKDNLKEVAKVTGLSMSELEDLFAPYLEINQTDAQAWITLDTYKERLNGTGQWTPAHETAYQAAIAGEQLDSVNTKLLAQPLKTVHAEPYMTANNEMIMQYNKQSEAVLLPFMKNTELGQLMKAMETKGVDHVITLDGKKAGASGIVDITDENNKIKPAGDIKMNPVNLSYNYLFLQQDLPTKQVSAKLVGSQMSKNVLSVVKLDGEYFNDLNGQEVTDLHHATIGRLSDAGLVELDKSLDYNPETKRFGFETDPNATSKVHKTVQKEFEGEISENHQQALEENIAFDALPIKTKIMNKLMALVTKKTVKLKQQGASLIQLSDLGFLGSEVKLNDKVKDGIVWFKDPTERLQPMHIKEGEVKAAQILMPHSKIVDMLAGSSKKAIEAQDALEKAHGTRNFKELTHEQLKDLIEGGVLEGLSYRIPNQGPSSNDAFEIVGILPAEMGDTMVAFSDVTTKTGSDFDIDKAFVMVPNFYFDAKAGKVKKVGYDLNNLEETSKAGLENLRLDLAREMLMHPSAYASVMAPLDDPWLEKAAKNLYPEVGAKRAMEFFTGRVQLNNKSTFDGAKSLIGVIANHMTSHSLFMVEDISFTDYYLGVGQTGNGGNTTLSNKFDVNGKEIAGTLGAYMNAIVDAAKDAYISRANINQTTAGTAFMLARAGVDRNWINAFMGQPAIKDLVAAQDAAEGRFGSPVYDEVNQKYLSAVETVLRKYGETEMTDSQFRESKAVKGLRRSKSESIKVSTSDLETAILNPEKSKLDQLAVLKQFLEYQGQAGQLNEVIKVSKADVEGATKNIVSAHLALNLMKKVTENDTFTGVNDYLGVDMSELSLTFKQGAEGKMIGRYFENSVIGALERFSRFFIAGSAASMETIEGVAGAAGYQSMTTNADLESLAFSISNEVYAHAASNTRAFNMNPEDLHTLLYGKTGQLSIADRVTKMQKDSSLSDNLLLTGLQVRSGRDGAPDKVMLPNTETVKETKEGLYAAWNELLGSENAEVRELGSDLAKYAFFTSGFSKSVGDFSEHIPTEWLNEREFNTDIQTARQTMDTDRYSLRETEDTIFKNLYKNNQLVPVLKRDSAKPIVWKDGGDLQVPLEDAFMIPQSDSLNYAFGEGPNGKIFKRFVKRSVPTLNQFGEVTGKEYMLYKLAGYTHNKDAVYVRTNTLGISGKGNNVKEYIGNPNTSIFAKNNVSLPQGLQNLVDVLEQRSMNPESTEISLDAQDKMGEVEDREVFCLMR